MTLHDITKTLAGQGFERSPCNNTIANTGLNQLWLTSGPLFQHCTTILLEKFFLMPKAIPRPLITLSGTTFWFHHLSNCHSKDDGHLHLLPTSQRADPKALPQDTARHAISVSWPVQLDTASNTH